MDSAAVSSKPHTTKRAGPCAECADLRRKLAEALATFKPQRPGGRFLPDGSALTDAKVTIRRHAEDCSTAPTALLAADNGA
jgi:hypothetical protein